MAEAVQLLAGGPLVRMVHTKHGAQVNCAVISYGSAKDRKKVIKAMAEHVEKLVNEEWGHVVLVCALSLVDDTTLLRKSLVPELQVSRGHFSKATVACMLCLPVVPAIVSCTLQYQQWSSLRCSMMTTMLTGGLIS